MSSSRRIAVTFFRAVEEHFGLVGRHASGVPGEHGTISAGDDRGCGLGAVWQYGRCHSTCPRCGHTFTPFDPTDDGRRHARDTTDSLVRPTKPFLAKGIAPLTEADVRHRAARRCTHAPRSRMRSRWSDEAAAEHPGPLGSRVYTSRLLGAETSLVMHGGGNTSVKVTEADLFGEPSTCSTSRARAPISPRSPRRVRAGAARPAARAVRSSTSSRTPRWPNSCGSRCTRARRAGAVGRGDSPRDPAGSLRRSHPRRRRAHASRTRRTAGSGSRSSTATGRRRRLRDARFRARPAVRARSSRRSAPTRPIGMVLMNHGVFSFGDTAREAYDRMIELVTLAEDYLQGCGAWDLPTVGEPHARPARRAGRARPARRAVGGRGRADDRRPRVARRGRPRSSRATTTPTLATAGPLTPDHVIRTKRVPLIGRDVGRLRRGVRAVLRAQHAPAAAAAHDARPGAAGRARPRARAAHRRPDGHGRRDRRDIASHTLDAIERADTLDGWQALPEGDLFDVEYWELEQAKLQRQARPPPCSRARSRS